MALPQVHAAVTAPIAAVSLWLYPPKTLENIAVFVAVIFFGIFLDMDHLSVRRIRRIISGDWTPLEDYVNPLHTWQALAVMVVLLVFTDYYLPLAAYTSHLLLDGANEYNKECKNAPFLTWLHQFYPRWLTYRVGPGEVSPFFSRIALLFKKNKERGER